MTKNHNGNQTASKIGAEDVDCRENRLNWLAYEGI